jgi:2-polyprenyl-3-methyl-5-hydroxy-6-metoxy-1,4-benzoquinol methylase
MLNLASPYGVTMCLDCGFRFLNPRPLSAEYARAYADGTGPLVETYKMNKDFYGEQDLIRMPQYRKKLDLLVKAGAKGRLLEIGACTGLFLNEAKKRGFEVEGIEPSEGNCRIARQNYNLNVHTGRVEDFNFPEGSFDVVFSSHVFEHLLNPLAATRKIVSWLRPGGFIMIEVPNQFDNLVFKLRRLAGAGIIIERTFLSIHHPVFFSPKTLRKLIELSGCYQYSMRNVYYSSKSIFQSPKLAVKKLLALISGGDNIEIIARKARLV